MLGEKKKVNAVVVTLPNALGTGKNHHLRQFSVQTLDNLTSCSHTTN